MGDIISGVVSLIFGIYIFISATPLPREAEIFPKIIGGLFVLLGAITAAKSFKSKSDSIAILKDIAFGKIFTTFILWVLAITLLETLGFYSSIFCFMALLCLLLAGKPYTTRSLISSIAFSAITVSVYWAVFYHIVELELPSGLFI